MISNTEKQIGIRLRPQDIKRVGKLCDKLEQSTSAVIRLAIRELAVKMGLERA